MIPERVVFVVSSGQRILGTFDLKSFILRGLFRICKMQGVPHLNCFNSVLLNYDGGYMFRVMVFDSSMVESYIELKSSLYGTLLNL